MTHVSLRKLRRFQKYVVTCFNIGTPVPRSCVPLALAAFFLRLFAIPSAIHKSSSSVHDSAENTAGKIQLGKFRHYVRIIDIGCILMGSDVDWLYLYQCRLRLQAVMYRRLERSVTTNDQILNNSAL